MHVPQAFSVQDPLAILTAMSRSRAVTLVTSSSAGMRATVVPVLHHHGAGGLGHLVGHVARGNRDVVGAHESDCLVVAVGAAGYISPGWYASKAEHGRVVPTWDYEVVEASGRLRTFTDPGRLLDLVTELTNLHESDQASPWQVSDAPPEYIEGLLGGIVGFEIELDHVQAKAKLSQNRPAADIDGVVEGLRAANPELASQVDGARTIGSHRD